MASARLTGTNEQVTTYDSAGGETYDNLGDWETDTDTNHVTDTETDVLECMAGAHTDTVTVGGGTNDEDYFRIIRPVSGQGHSGIPLSNGSVVEFNGTGNAHLFRLGGGDELYIQIQDVVGTHNPDSTNDRRIFVTSGDENAVIGCLAYDSTNDGTGEETGIYLNAGVGLTSYAVDCLAHNLELVGIILSGGANYAYNCTSTNNVTGFLADSGETGIVINCLGNGNTNDYVETGTFTDTTCGSGDGTSPTVALQNDSYTFVDSVNDNFQLASNTVDGVDDGTDLSGDANYPFDDDVVGNIWAGTWDIGFWETATAVGVLLRNLALTGVGK